VQQPVVQQQYADQQYIQAETKFYDVQQQPVSEIQVCKALSY
jgi:hypothetical protein